jgi:hypothetical protein
VERATHSRLWVRSSANRRERESCFIIEISANCWQRATWYIDSLRCFRGLPLSFFYASGGGRSLALGCNSSRCSLGWQIGRSGYACPCTAYKAYAHSARFALAERLCNWESLQCLLTAKKCFLGEMFHILCWPYFYADSDISSFYCLNSKLLCQRPLQEMTKIDFVEEAFFLILIFDCLFFIVLET